MRMVFCKERRGGKDSNASFVAECRFRPSRVSSARGKSRHMGIEQKNFSLGLKRRRPGGK